MTTLKQCSAGNKSALSYMAHFSLHIHQSGKLDYTFLYWTTQANLHSQCE